MLCSVVKHAGNGQSTKRSKGETEDVFPTSVYLYSKYVVPANQDARYVETLL